MNQKVRVASVCREDILTIRGANPRTGLITPFVSVGNSEDNDENDYVHVGRVQNERDLKVGHGERWRQDAFGWKLVGCTNHHGDAKSAAAGSSNANAAIAAREQTYDSWSLGQDPSSVRKQVKKQSKVDQSAQFGVPEAATSKDIHASSPSQIPPLSSSKVPSGCSFQIPRKEVGSRSASPALTASPCQQRDPSSRYTQHTVTLKDKALRTLSPDHPDSTSLGLHAYAAALPAERSNQAIPLQSKRRYGSLGHPEGHKNQEPYLPDVFAPRIDSLPPSDNPNLKATYRRPEELLPARLRAHQTSKGNANVEGSHGCRVPRGHMIAEQRPHLKRVQATTTVPIAQFTKHTDSHTNKSPAACVHGTAFTGQCHDRPREATNRATSSSPISGSACAARKAFINMQAYEPHPITVQKPYPDGEPEKDTLLLKSRAQSNSRAISTSELTHGTAAQMKHQIGPKAHCASATNKNETEQAKCQQVPLVRRKSMRNALEARDSLLNFAREIGGLVDWNRVLGQLSGTLEHAALTFRQMPWAVRTLRSQNAKVWDYLLAVRYMVTTLLYLAVLLGFLGAVLRVLKLVVEVGNCFWYPIALLLTMVRWILLH